MMENQSNKNGTQQDDHSISKQSTEQHTQSTNDPIYKILIVIGGLLGFGTLAGIFLPAIILAIGMGLTDNPNRFKFELPYNAIDFQKIAYIDNQFVMYGIDYNSDSCEHDLVIFNSKNGESWTKSKIAGVNPENESEAHSYYDISREGTFIYYNNHCFLIGATSYILSSTDCNHWQYIKPHMANKSAVPLWGARGSAIANSTLYVAANFSGIYSTTDGYSWKKEELPVIEESGINKYQNIFNSIAAGDNKIVALKEWNHDNKQEGVIYTKNLATNKWSYDVYPVAVRNITRGKDRFVAMTESTALVLIDKSQYWNSYDLPAGGDRLTFGLNDLFIDISGMSYLERSYDGETWNVIEPKERPKKFILDAACSKMICIGAGTNYYTIYTFDGITYYQGKFNHENQRLHWWKRFF